MAADTAPPAATPRWKQPGTQLLALAVAAALFYAGQFVAQQLGWVAAGAMAGADVESTIEDAYRQQGAEVSVTCPAEVPIQKNKITDCTATGNGRTTSLTVTVLDLDGHYTYQVNDPLVLYPSG